MKDYYYILGVSRYASKEEIKQAYRNLSLKLHADKNDDEAYRKERFNEISEAYETLVDTEERRLYDKKLANAVMDDSKSNSEFQNAAINQSASVKPVSLPQQNVETKKRKPNRWLTFLGLLFVAVAITYSVGKNHQTKEPTVRTIPDSDRFKNLKDEITLAKKETEDLIIRQFNKNVNDLTHTDQNQIVHIFKLHDAYFTPYDFAISIDDEYTPKIGNKVFNNAVISIPVADINTVTFFAGMMYFGTNNKTIMFIHGLTDSVYIPLNFDINSDTEDSLKHEFLHLQKFYQMPPSTNASIPSHSIYSLLTKGSGENDSSYTSVSPRLMVFKATWTNENIEYEAAILLDDDQNGIMRVKFLRDNQSIIIEEKIGHVETDKFDYLKGSSPTSVTGPDIANYFPDEFAISAYTNVTDKHVNSDGGTSELTFGPNSTSEDKSFLAGFQWRNE